MATVPMSRTRTERPITSHRTDIRSCGGTNDYGFSWHTKKLQGDAPCLGCDFVSASSWVSA